MTTGYWTTALTQRISRRRALAATGAASVGAALLAACGGGSDSATKAPKNNSGLLYTLVDDTKSAIRGGRHVTIQDNVFTSLDPYRPGQHSFVVSRGYSQIFRISDGYLQQTSGTPQGDLAESWEVSPDKLQITVKLDPGAGFAPIPPVNGRIVDSEDILFSWERFKSVGTLAGDLVNDKNPAAPVVSIAAPDKRTLVIKLSEPNATIFTLLGQSPLGSFWTLPKEAAEPAKLDIARTAIGSGPYYLVEGNEVNVLYKRNPNFKRASLKNNEPYIDEVFTPVIPSAATQSAEFRAGNIYQVTIPPNEVVGVKKDIPALNMYATDPIATERIYFGHNSDSPFRDQRVRLAYYKCFDRDLYIQAAYNTDNFVKDGLPVVEHWEGNFHTSSWSGYVLDPKSEKDYGAAAKNFKHDLAEAKKLVEAAGYKAPYEYIQNQATENPTSFPNAIYRRMDILMNMLDESGVFKVKRRFLEYSSEWNTPLIRQSGGKFNGASWGPDTVSFDPTAASFSIFNSKGSYLEGTDPTLDDLTLKARREFDEKKRQDIIKEIQRHDATTFFNQKVGVAGGFNVIWPAVRNIYVYRGGTNWQDVRGGSGLKAFIDPSKAPLKKS